MTRPTILGLAACALAASACGGEPGREAGVRAGLSVASVLAGADTAGYARATEPRTFRFPADHGPHPEFRTEWWYLTGNLEDPGGRRFGYQLTFFRSAVAPRAPERDSEWATNQVYMAHFALTDVDAGRFHAFERFARSALGLAGARVGPLRVWLEDWIVEGAGGEGGTHGDPFPIRLRAAEEGVRLDLEVARGKPPVLQGRDGLSAKGPEPGNASYYYSFTRMPTRGTVTVDGRTSTVEGLSWLDREWSTSALGPDLEGWDWFALQLDDGHELMLYRLRRSGGGVAQESGGAWVRPDGSARILDADDAEVEIRDRWTSPGGEARYPAGWRVTVPSRGVELRVRPVLDHQEWRATFRYWEGAVDAEGRVGETPVAGRGYVELTGYAGRAPPGG